MRVLIFLVASLCFGQGQLATFMGTHSTGVIAMIGHSWVEGKTESVPLVQALQARYGNAGFGYTPCYAQSILGQGAGRTLSGTWTDIDPVNMTPNTFVGADLYAANSTDVATPANCQIRIIVALGIQSTFDVHYLAQPNGGDFTYSINNQTPVTVHTAAGAKAFGHTGAIAVTGSPVLGATRLDITVTVAGSAGVTIFGADWRIAANGIVLHPLGHSGAATIDFLTVNQTLWAAELAALAPDIIYLQGVINDWATSVGSTQYNTNLTALIAEWHTAVPNAIIIVTADPQQGQSFTPTLVTYETGLLTYTRANPTIGLIDLYAHWYTYPTSSNLGYIQGNNHPSTAGGASLAGVMQNYLLGISAVNVSGSVLFGGSVLLQ